MTDLVSYEQQLTDIIAALDKLQVDSDDERKQLNEVVAQLNQAANKLTPVVDNYIEG